MLIKNKMKLITLFSGIGMQEEGIKNTNQEYELVNYCEYEKTVSKCFSLLHKEPESKNLGDITELDIKKYYNKLQKTGNDDIDVLISSFPCFVKGTPVLTYEGYKSIEDVKIEDKLMTHTGEFRDIINLQSKVYDSELYEVKVVYRPNAIKCTEEHPFYCKSRSDKPVWKPVKDIKRDDFLGMVINTRSRIPKFSFENKINAESNTENMILDKNNQWFMLGFFMGEYRDRDSLDHILTLSEDITKQNDCSNFLMYSILKQFGELSSEKRIPEWVQDAPHEYIKDFLNGYMKVTGFTQDTNDYNIKSMSQDFAYGIQRLFLKVGHVFSVDITKDNGYVLKPVARTKDTKTFFEDGYVWFPIEDINKKIVDNETVYNFEVDVDNSYVVDNTVVHNCQSFSIAGNKNGFECPKNGKLFDKSFEMISTVKPKIVIFENVKNITSYKFNAIEKITNQMESVGYKCFHKVLNATDYGIPQNRERWFMVCVDKDEEDFEFPEPIPLTKCVNDFLSDIPNDERKVSKSLVPFFKDEYKQEYKSNKGLIKVFDGVSQNYFKTGFTLNRIYSVNGICPTLTTSNDTHFWEIKGRLEPEERWRLMGLDEEKLEILFDNNISDSHINKICGNGIVVDVFEHLFRKIKNTYMFIN